MSVDKTAKAFMEAMQPKNQPKAYDTPATVVRVEGDTLWVHIPGGVDETPIKKTVGASVGDEVQVRVAGGRAWAVGNASAPPTDDTQANIATSLAGQALQDANSAKTSAEIAAAAADAAQASANTAASAASQAVTQAGVAYTAAREAKTQAQSATDSASSALTQLSVVEDVVGVLNWISEHGTYKATSDTEVVNGKPYFTRSGSGTTADPYVYTVVASPASDPSAAGYYELDSIDEAVSNYVSTHLALTSEGLYIISDNNSWRVLIKNDGVYIINASGDVVAQYKDTIVLGKTSKGHAEIDFNSFELYDTTGGVYASMGDMRDSFGEATVVENFSIESATSTVTVSFSIASVVSVTVNDVAVTPASASGKTISFSSDLSDGDVVLVEYKTTAILYHYDLGTRASETLVGPYSCVIGENQTASGRSSTIGGGSTNTASGLSSVVSGGYNNTASKNYATVGGGSGNAASGGSATIGGGANNTASGDGATVGGGGYGAAHGYCATVGGGDSNTANGAWATIGGGRDNTASGSYSVVPGGQYNEANHSSQFVFGEFNAPDPSTAPSGARGNYVEIVGNGTYNSRSNARTLDWDGNEVLAGKIFANGNRDILSEIDSLTNSLARTTAAPTITIAGTTSVARLDKSGKVVVMTLNIDITDSFTTTGWKTLGTIPEGWRPAEATRGIGFFVGAGACAQINAASGGALQMYADISNSSGSTKKLRVAMTWITA